MDGCKYKYKSIDYISIREQNIDKNKIEDSREHEDVGIQKKK